LASRGNEIEKARETKNPKPKGAHQDDFKEGKDQAEVEKGKYLIENNTVLGETQKKK